MIATSSVWKTRTKQSVSMSLLEMNQSVWFSVLVGAASAAIDRCMSWADFRTPSRQKSVQVPAPDGVEHPPGGKYIDRMMTFPIHPVPVANPVTYQ